MVKVAKCELKAILEVNFWKIEFLEASSPNFPWSSPESVPGSAKITSWTFGIRKNILFEILKYFLNHLNKFEDLSWCLSWFVLGLLVHFCSWFFHLGNVYVMSIVSIIHAVYFSKQEVLRRLAACGSSSESECSWNNGKKKQQKLNFFSM